MNFELLAVIALVILAFGDLIVGVINDAVNFLNSAIGSKVAKRTVILSVAAVGIIIGSTFSDGIIEVARKGIFYPSFFDTTEVIIIFTAVAIADIILLDLYSTFGLPTSTTVSVVFELLGAALAMALWKTGSLTNAWEVINHASASKIILGIVLSVGIAFSAGLIVQFISRLIFTFDYKERFKRWGFIWSGVALTSLVFFILMKGAKHATFMTPEIKDIISTNSYLILSACFVFFSGISLILIKSRVNILKIIVLIGTASLAMAFAGNDLANFIGVSIAGVNAFLGADLSGSLPTPSWVLLLAGLTMTFALFTSKKAKTVTKTELNLASHEKGVKNVWKKRFFISKFVNLVTFIFDSFKKIIPTKAREWISSRWKEQKNSTEKGSHFDLIRASVNLMVAAAVISYATSKKLPLSTTYVTFMVAMGTALADGAWKRDCGPSRLAGVLAVISGWFGTALIAIIMAGIAVSILYLTNIYGLIGLFLLVIVLTTKFMKLHKKRSIIQTQS
ncbi:hypothetical protein HN709_02800 [Candidatus Peregrinibacteria bacterium]|jgi:phosphate/sulfate permease|nr:hypothetical protein [Candidatus Peregrinibacteria bacterium]MBT7736593.1 hypothetical protein [Candidatus Peregrinibacteria bacterium]